MRAKTAKEQPKEDFLEEVDPQQSLRLKRSLPKPERKEDSRYDGPGMDQHPCKPVGILIFPVPLGTLFRETCLPASAGPSLRDGVPLQKVPGVLFSVMAIGECRMSPSHSLGPSYEITGPEWP